MKVLSIYREMHYPLSRIEVQKLAYFLVRAGQNMGLVFTKHTYGPYADALRHVLIKLDGAYLRGVGDGAKPSEITVVGSALAEAEAFLNSQQDVETVKRVERIDRLIDGFETPYGMELLASVDWVAAEAPGANYEEILRRVHGWSNRKRQIVKPEHVKAAYDRLVSERWVAAP